MMDLFILGTGGTYPLATRALASAFIRVEGKGILIDCGEATQIEMQKYSLGFSSIDCILITHMHADHVSGLLGMLLAIKQAQRTKPITIVGPKGIERYVNTFYMITSKFSCPINFIELENTTDINPRVVLNYNNQIFIKAIQAKHSRVCFGYSIEVKRKAKFQFDKAMQNGIPNKTLLEYFCEGNSFSYNGVYYNADLVPEEKRMELLRGYLHKKKFGLYTIVNNNYVFQADVSKEKWNQLKEEYEINCNGFVVKRKDLCVSLISDLDKGKSFSFNGHFFKSADYKGGHRRGLKISYITDTRPLPQFRDFIKGSDIAILEGMYRDEERRDKAISEKHMMWTEALALAKNNDIGEVILTHFSPSLQIASTDKYLVKSMLPNAFLGFDGMYKDLNFIDDETNKTDEKEKGDTMKSSKQVEENKNNFRIKYVKKFLERMAYTDAVVGVKPISAYAYDVELLPNYHYTAYVYKDIGSMKESYESMLQIDDYYVFFKKS